MRKLFSICVLLLLLNGCKSKVDCIIYGYVYSNNGEPIEQFEIQDMVKLSPRDFNFQNIEYENKTKGSFFFRIEKKLTIDDRKYDLYFKKDGYNDVVKTIDLTKRKINLDTIYLKKHSPTK